VHYEYDEEASQAWHMDVVHEVDDMPVSVERWQESNRRLNGIHDALARKILALHEKCGSGDGECDGASRNLNGGGPAGHAKLPN